MSAEAKKIMLYSIFIKCKFDCYKNEPVFRGYFVDYLNSIRNNATDENVIDTFINKSYREVLETDISLLFNDTGIRDKMYEDFIESGLTILSGLIGGLL